MLPQTTNYDSEISKVRLKKPFRKQSLGQLSMIDLAQIFAPLSTPAYHVAAVKIMHANYTAYKNDGKMIAFEWFNLNPCAKWSKFNYNIKKIKEMKFWLRSQISRRPFLIAITTKWQKYCRMLSTKIRVENNCQIWGYNQICLL